MPKLEKGREPTLLDRLEPMNRPDHLVREYLRPALSFPRQRESFHQFVLDRESSDWLTETAVELADLVEDNADFAKPPFPKTYVQYPFAKESESVGFIYSDGWGYMLTVITDYSALIEPPEEAGWAVVALYGGRIHWETGRVELIPVQRLDGEKVSLAEEQAYDENARTALRSIRLWTQLLFMLMARPTMHSIESNPRVSIQRRGRRVVYGATSVVKLKLLSQPRVERSLYTGSRAAARRHSVRGHFAHYHYSRGCSHEWDRLTDEDGKTVDRWLCARCGGLRVWRKSFHRGDATVGFTRRDHYEVSL